MFYQKKAFSLIELIVWIVIISIVSLWITKLFWNKIPDKLRLDLFTNRVTWVIDSVKNYALVWKWIWPNLDTPKYFKIDLSRSWSYIKTYYNTGGIDNYYSPMSLNPFWEYYQIFSIKCNNLTLSSWSFVPNISISYKWSNITFSWCDNDYQKIVDIELYYKWFKNKLRLNSISWVLEQVSK